MDIDKYDARILFELDKNARSTTTHIGASIRKSKQFVDYRIKKLEQEQVLQGYVAVIDHSRLGYVSVRVYFKFHDITPEQQKQIETELTGDKEVWWLVTLEGPWDVGYAMALKDMVSFYDYWDRIMAKYRQSISKSSVVVYTHIRQFPKAYLIDKKNEEEGTLVGAAKEKEIVDSKDMAILRYVSDHARASIVEIGAKVGMSHQIVKNRLKALQESGVLQGYRALIDVSRFGYRYYKAYLSLKNTEKINALQQFCKQHPNILNVNKTIGGHDFEIELQAKSFDEFTEIMNSIRESFKGMVDEYEFVIAREEKKMIYFPFE